MAAYICMNKEFERPGAVFSLSLFSLSLLFGSCWKQSRRPVSHLVYCVYHTVDLHASLRVCAAYDCGLVHLDSLWPVQQVSVWRQLLCPTPQAFCCLFGSSDSYTRLCLCLLLLKCSYQHLTLEMSVSSWSLHTTVRHRKLMALFEYGVEG